MKVYVDKLPKDCIDCPCESEYYCNLLNEDIGCCKCGEIHKDCPLQTLADHDKQVRKQVCDEIYEKCEPLFRLVNNYDNGDVIERNELVDILDQIEKGEENDKI